jgi:RNA polymerase sigma factor (sigma-70 family)
MPIVAETDGELFQRARAGDHKAWDALVQRLGSRIWAVARAHRLGRADAEDVFQVTWMQLVTHVDDIREPERVSAWLASTARHESLRVLRRAGREAPSADENQTHIADPDLPAPEAALVAAERKGALDDALASLGAACQRLLRLFLADPPPSYQDVSEALGMPIGSIGPTRGRCLEQLRSRLERITEGAAGSRQEEVAP